ncbi:hypothetical protein OPT61_g2242 [Boeremia exigua]|uniref:Uncharacterized protein n=1 Tax=Boeremia exigua TaxID=749465 RepID=A0ACC2IM59_9PLEO|nr:hypothetical protein OPT61_g2242 [Boeremia exigua]
MGDRSERSEYHPLQDEETCRESEEVDPASQTKPLRASQSTLRYRRILYVIVFIGLASVPPLIALVLFRSSLPPWSTTRPSEPGTSYDLEPCGQTAFEAKGRGCMFDFGLGSWLPPSCYNKELAEDYRLREPFEFYYTNSNDSGPDFNRQIPTIELLAMNPHRSWTTRRYHVTHCMHAWTYMHTAVTEGRNMSQTTSNLGHTKHCSNVVSNANSSFGDITTSFEVDFPACVS